MDDETMFKKLNSCIRRLKILEKSSIYKEQSAEKIELLEHIKTKIEEENK